MTRRRAWKSYTLEEFRALVLGEAPVQDAGDWNR